MSGKNIMRLLLGLLIGAALLLVMITFQVRFNEMAIVETLGRPADEPVSAGLHLRWPWPVQRVIKYDTRVQEFESIFEQMQTQDGKNVLISVFVCWNIEKPTLYRQAVGEDLERGQSLVRSLVRDATLKIVGRNPMQAFASLNADEVRLETMEQSMLELVQDTAATQYGVRVRDIGIKRSGLPEDVTKVVIENMKSERMAKAQRARSQGEAYAASIESEARRIAEQVMSFARLRADQIKADGRAQAAEYYERFSEDEEFAMFLRSLEYLRETLKDKTMFILDGTTLDVSNGWFRKPPTAANISEQR